MEDSPFDKSLISFTIFLSCLSNDVRWDKYQYNYKLIAGALLKRIESNASVQYFIFSEIILKNLRLKTPSFYGTFNKFVFFL